MKVIAEGTKEEIKEFALSSVSDCYFSIPCYKCDFNTDVGCALKNNNALEFIKEYAEFKICDTDKTIDNDTEMTETKDNNTEMSETQVMIDRILGAITQLLKVKNSRYGNAVFEPMRVFCKKDKEESDIPARLDDKLSRIKNSDKIRINDVTDLIGYLVLLLIQLGCTETDILRQID